MINRILIVLALLVGAMVVAAPAEARTCDDDYTITWTSSRPGWGTIKQIMTQRKCTQNDGDRVIDLQRIRFTHDDCGGECVTYDVDHKLTYRNGDRQLTIYGTTDGQSGSVSMDLSDRPDWPITTDWSGWYHWNVLGPDTEGANSGELR